MGCRATKKGLQTALEAEVAQEVEALLGREALAELDFEALEVALRQRTLRHAAYAIQQRLNADVPMKSVHTDLKNLA